MGMRDHHRNMAGREPLIRAATGAGRQAMSEALQTQGSWLRRTVFERLDTIALASHSTRQPRRGVDQLAPTFVVPAFHEHAIEHERRGNQAPHALRDTRLASLNAACVFLRERFHDRPLRPDEIRGAVLEATERSQLTSFA
jgi:hypothetical protein